MCCTFGIKGTGYAQRLTVAAAGEFDLLDVDASDFFGVCYGPLGIFAAWVKKGHFVHNDFVLNGLYCFLICSGGLPQLLEAADDEESGHGDASAAAADFIE